MKDYVDIVVGVATLITLVAGLYFAIRRFGLRREAKTFLQITVGARSIAKTPSTALVAIAIRLENRGGTRITARSGRRNEEGYLYDDLWDRCLHSGTLKIRPVEPRDKAHAFDWYSLPPLDATLQICTVDDQPHAVPARPGSLEQINFLDDYQDPVGRYAESDFWLEPREIYELVIPVWLPPGHYAAKAFFFGNCTDHGEEEYWSHTAYFCVRPPRAA